MRLTLRGVLAILVAGLVLGALDSVFLYFGGTYHVDPAGINLALGPLLAVIGLLVLWVGRREWSRVSGHGLLGISVAVGLSGAGLAGVLGLVGWYAYEGATSFPILALWGFGFAVWATLFLTFAAFALIAYEPSGGGGRLLIIAGLVWAAVITGWIAAVLAHEIGSILQAAELRTMNVGPITGPVTALEGYLAPAYFLLLFGYLDAIRRAVPGSVKQGRVPTAQQVT
jgi:hypothetical protein